MDMFINDSNDIAAGNMRSRAGEQMSAAASQHNQLVANNITQIHKDLQNRESQLSEVEALKGVQTGVEGLLGANKLREGLTSYREWSQKGATKQSRLAQLKAQAPDGADGDLRVAQGDNGEVTVDRNPANTTQAPPETATPEGTPATGTSDTAPTVEAHESVTVGEDGAGKSGSMIHDGIKQMTGLSDEAVEKVGKGAGALGSGIAAGMNIYQDIKAGGIAGDNGWEKAGNVTQIGGAIADTVGVFFPPAELVGGVLDLIGGGLDAIGEIFDHDDKKKEAQAEAQKQEQEQQEAEKKVAVGGGPSAPQVAQARVQ
tara:strand:- start:8827 stop:9771 length:945 start_codon:yes stop_codon:yes gene_type:complete